jgi:16S rRNA processing protein RimM
MSVQEGINAGKISKPYGLRGEVSVILNPALANHIETGIPLFIDLDGQRVPYFIQELEMLAPDRAIVKFEFVDGIEEAGKVAGKAVFMDPDTGIKVSEQENELAGVVQYHVIDQRLGPLGRVVDYIPEEMNPVWIIDFSGKELVVPATADFILNIDHQNRSLHLDLPEGITEL